MSLLALLLLTFGCQASETGVSLSPREPVKNVWRDAAHAGTNSLYCFLKIHGKQIPQSEFETREGNAPLPQNVAELIAFARDLGHELEARSVSPDDLAKIPLPAIIHFDGDDISQGSLNILLQVDSRRFVFMDGATAIVSSVNREPFLRRWSGVVVMFRQERERLSPAVASSVGIVAGFLLVIFLLRR